MTRFRFVPTNCIIYNEPASITLAVRRHLQHLLQVQLLLANGLRLAQLELEQQYLDQQQEMLDQQREQLEVLYGINTVSRLVYCCTMYM